MFECDPFTIPKMVIKNGNVWIILKGQILRNSYTMASVIECVTNYLISVNLAVNQCIHLFWQPSIAKKGKNDEKTQLFGIATDKL